MPPDYALANRKTKSVLVVGPGVQGAENCIIVVNAQGCSVVADADTPHASGIFIQLDRYLGADRPSDRLECTPKQVGQHL